MFVWSTAPIAPGLAGENLGACMIPNGFGVAFKDDYEAPEAGIVELRQLADCH